MKKVCTIIMAFAMGLTMFGCGKTDSGVNIDMASPANLQENMKNNAYFDTSDLSRVGTYKQLLWNGCDYLDTDQIDEDVFYEYDKYENGKGDVFCFDETGRMVRFLSHELIEEGGSLEDGFIPPYTVMTSEMREASLAAVKSCIPESDGLAVKSIEAMQTYYTNAESVSDPADQVTASVTVNADGDVLHFSAEYGNVAEKAIDYDYFEKQLDAYLTQKQAENPQITDYECDPYFAELNGRIYGIYTITFEETTDQYDDVFGKYLTSNFSEIVGFSHEKKS